MRSVIQRVSRAEVRVEGRTVGAIAGGLVALVGKEEADTQADVEWLANKIVNLRIFADAHGVMSKSVRDIGGGLLVVSQFTLFASTRKGTRPSWHRAAKPDTARVLYEALVSQLGTLMGAPVQTGIFGAHMEVDLVNDGPVTILIDTKTRE